MRKLTYAIAMLVALVATGYAVADGIQGAKSANKVAGTFTATGTSTSSRTCTTDDGKTVVVTDGKYTGAASGDPDLTGTITLRARSVVNTTDKVGVVTGSLRIDTSGKSTNASYSAVYDNGSISGLAVGRAHDHGVALVGNLSAGFDAATGFTSGKIGGGTSGGSAVEVGGKGCKSTHQPNEKSEARGTITSLGTTITVAGLTCNVGSVDVSKFKQGDFVDIRCSFANNANTLTSISGGGKGGDDGKHHH
jgi:hypothetical protein